MTVKREQACRINDIKRCVSCRKGNKSMKKIFIKDDFIKLGQAMKLAGLVDSGVDAKYVIEDGKVKVNGEVDLRRGKKLYPGDIFSFQGTEVIVEEKTL